MVEKNELDRCDCNVIHEDIVNAVKVKMPGEENLYDLAELFKVFGDTTRIKILWALFESEMCVCDIAVLLNMTQSAISHQLRVLKQARLVKSRKGGNKAWEKTKLQMNQSMSIFQNFLLRFRKYLKN